MSTSLAKPLPIWRPQAKMHVPTGPSRQARSARWTLKQKRIALSCCAFRLSTSPRALGGSSRNYTDPTHRRPGPTRGVQADDKRDLHRLPKKREALPVKCTRSGRSGTHPARAAQALQIMGPQQHRFQGTCTYRRRYALGNAHWTLSGGVRSRNRQSEDAAGRQRSSVSIGTLKLGACLRRHGKTASAGMHLRFRYACPIPAATCVRGRRFVVKIAACATVGVGELAYDVTGYYGQIAEEVFTIGQHSDFAQAAKAIR
jgi:hypothetical protein